MLMASWCAKRWHHPLISDEGEDECWRTRPGMSMASCLSLQAGLHWAWCQRRSTFLHAVLNCPQLKFELARNWSP
jgi:hypothetical protein